MATLLQPSIGNFANYPREPLCEWWWGWYLLSRCRREWQCHFKWRGWFFRVNFTHTYDTSASKFTLFCRLSRALLQLHSSGSESQSDNDDLWHEFTIFCTSPIPRKIVTFSDYEEPGVSGSESESADSECEQDTPSGFSFTLWPCRSMATIRSNVFPCSIYNYSNWS